MIKYLHDSTPMGQSPAPSADRRAAGAAQSEVLGPAHKWAGHLPQTSATLLSILYRIAAGSTDLSLNEWSLRAMCELWASVNNKVLITYLGEDAGRLLITACVGFRIIGSTQVVSVLERGADELARKRASTERLVCIRNIEKKLRDTTDPVDQLLLKYARNCRPLRVVRI